MRILFLLITLSGLIWSSTAQAQTTLDMHSFKNLPIMHEGRLKPMDSFATLTLKQLSGKTHLGKFSATGWLALTLFDPQNSTNIPVFKIEDKALLAKLNLEQKDLYTLSELTPLLQQTHTDLQTLLQKDTQSLTSQEQALLQLHENAALLTNLMRSFSALLPLAIQLPEKYQKHLEGAPNFIELVKLEKQLEENIREIVATKGQNPTQYTPEELSIAQAGFHVQTMRAAGKNNLLLRVIPSNWEQNNTEWFSPWGILLSGNGSPDSAFLMSQWTELVKAYRSQNKELWANVAQDILSETSLQSDEQVNPAKFTAERLYRQWNPYLWTIGLYLIAIAAALATHKKLQNKIPAKLPNVLALTGLILHAGAILTRIYILDRPPVGSLYESILFVTFICAFAGFWTSRGKQSKSFLIAGLASAIALLLCAPIFQPSGDNLEVLVAVLNTNFWLTTHVLCITAGYGVCILAACLSHVALYIKGFKNDKSLKQSLQQNIYRLSIGALFLTALGTVLGGIWADQSWGRFWGWDPKENGALLIVLWLIWVQHARLSNKIGMNTFLALTAMLNIIVALSWFGVNLLNVGLHSYGFTSGLATGLAAFCIVQTTLITALFVKARKAKC